MANNFNNNNNNKNNNNKRKIPKPSPYNHPVLCHKPKVVPKCHNNLTTAQDDLGLSNIADRTKIIQKSNRNGHSERESWLQTITTIIIILIITFIKMEIQLHWE